MSAAIEAWVGDGAFTPHPTIGEVVTSPTMMDDQLALPALRLIWVSRQMPAFFSA